MNIVSHAIDFKTSYSLAPSRATAMSRFIPRNEFLQGALSQTRRMACQSLGNAKRFHPDDQRPLKSGALNATPPSQYLLGYDSHFSEDILNKRPGTASGHLIATRDLD